MPYQITRFKKLCIKKAGRLLYIKIPQRRPDSSDSARITFCKPCSVPLYCKRCGVISYEGGNHLSTSNTLVSFLVHFLRKSASTMIWVAHLRGLPRSTFTVSRKASSLWHFQGYSAMPLKV